MTYFLHQTISGDFEHILAKTREALAEQGFGVLTEIDMQATLKKKLNQDISPYLILGACHPPSAAAALAAEPRIGLLLPCNVIVRQLADDRVEVAAIDPAAMLAPLGTEALGTMADDVRGRLERALSSLV